MRLGKQVRELHTGLLESLNPHPAQDSPKFLNRQSPTQSSSTWSNNEEPEIKEFKQLMIQIRRKTIIISIIMARFYIVGQRPDRDITPATSGNAHK